VEVLGESDEFSNLGMRRVGIDSARLAGCSLGSMTLDDDGSSGLLAWTLEE